MELENLKYPIGRFNLDKVDWQLEELLQAVVKIQSLPNDLARLIKDIKPEDLNKTYREGSWTVQQIIHHLADSHMNAWIRTKLTLTEETPTVKPYVEQEWAKGNDYGYTYESSYIILVGLHQRWSLLLLETLKTPELLLRKFIHPEHGKQFSLAQLIAQYSWHGEHHLCHMRLAMGLMN